MVRLAAANGFSRKAYRAIQLNTNILKKQDTLYSPFRHYKDLPNQRSTSPYLPYINKNTNLILIQNGLGVLELLREEIFTDSKNRPHLFQGVISHGVYQDKAGVFNHAGWAGMENCQIALD
ncbi:CFS_G0024170.mRNA.1.CDS.1 [Saccharomyces cerevisiae]|nr:CFS_G0024170.mRNA.1.CDS.1 [Saccharomyces cerevisiae]CAI7332814.1 CFS_G0024170.mRNA.1.CDS.1 [Saccharomyces cerevisiae]